MSTSKYTKKKDEKDFREWKKNPSKLKLDYLDRFVKGDKILDIGCGRGFYSEYLANKGYNVISVDTKMQYTPNKSEFNLVDARNLPYESDSFDTVLLFDILEHSDDRAILKEVKRVCSTRAIISVPNANDSYLPKYNLTFKHHKDKGHKREYRKKEIEKILKEHGFSVEHMRLEGRVSPFVFGEFMKPPVSTIFLPLIFLLNKLKLFSNMPKADIYVVADKR